MITKVRNFLAGKSIAVAIVASALMLSIVQLRAFEYQPQMRAAMENLRQAEANLQKADVDKGGHRVKALELVRDAEREVQRGIEFDNRTPDRH